MNSHWVIFYSKELLLVLRMKCLIKCWPGILVLRCRVCFELDKCKHQSASGSVSWCERSSQSNRRLSWNHCQLHNSATGNKNLSWNRCQLHSFARKSNKSWLKLTFVLSLCQIRFPTIVNVSLQLLRRINNKKGL